MSFPDHLITRDLVAVALERRIIERYVARARTVLDVGCGTGATLRWLAERAEPGQTFVGLEPNPALFAEAADQLTRWPRVGDLPAGVTVTLQAGDHTTISGHYDGIYTQRMLIQLPTWEAQREAIDLLRSHLTPEGRLVCVEPSIRGLRYLNEVRHVIGLPMIVPPGHTLYMHSIPTSCRGLLHQGSFGEHYSFLSRVVEAYRAQQEGREPRYLDPESIEGRLCLALPNTGEGIGQYHYSVWGADHYYSVWEAA